MKTALEILMSKKDEFDFLNELCIEGDTDVVLEAMEEYAAQFKVEEQWKKE
jgi:hypothetical protein